MQKISQSALQLVCEFPFSNYYETRDINLEIANLFEFKKSFHYGYCSDDITKKSGFSRIYFLTISLPNNILVSFNYNNLGDYLVFLAKENKVFEYRNHLNEAWIKKEQFQSFEGLNVIYTIQKFLNSEITENLHEVEEGLTFESFSTG